VRGNKRLLHAPVIEIIEKPRGVKVNSTSIVRLPVN